MKNIHILPTDKPSRLYTYQNNLNLTTSAHLHTKSMEYKNIYITSDKEIKEDRCWVINSMNKKESVPHLKWGKLIILTTDQDLIKDGVQAIDDEFLEWFVKNPSCEEVEVQKWFDGVYFTEYKIIIPKEEELSKDEIDRLFIDMVFNPKKEHKQDRTCSNNCSDVCGECQILQPKQETLEEVAEKYATSITKKWIKGDVCNSEKEDIIVHFVSGAKWQQEQDKNKYSEEDLISLLEFNYKKETNQLGTLRKDYSQKIVREWFEQFKNK